jgi:DNA-binding NarL/FixJ family response regulator
MAGRAPGRESVFDQVKQLVGEDVVQKLQLAYAGRQMYVPKDVAEDHALAKVIGVEATARLSKMFGGMWLAVPGTNAARRLRIRLLKSQGLKPRDIAATLGCSERYVYVVLAEDRETT